MPVAVVTDSTADLPASLCAERRVTVVPLTVAIDGVSGMEGVDVGPAEVERALSTRRSTVTTSRPNPAAFATAYRTLLAGGADRVVSVHLSGRLSGTCDSARLAAAEFGGRVEVVDSRSAAMGLGFVVLAAAAVAAGGAGVAEVRVAATATAGRVHTFFYVDTLDFLRRGGRVGAATALVGTALSVKPILHVVDGGIVLREKVRTPGRALARLADLAVAAAGDGRVDLALHHLAAPQRAAELAATVADRLGDRLLDRHTSQLGAAIAAHVGPGVVGVVVHRRP
ncbi:MAG TPA: DegV family protein [Pilimelia sp.]|nr:DegV family protein [Pilimelia sp.]